MDSDGQQEQVMTTREAAAFLKISPNHLSQKALRGEIPATKKLGQWRFLRSELLDWLRGGHGANGAAH